MWEGGGGREVSSGWVWEQDRRGDLFPSKFSEAGTRGGRILYLNAFFCHLYELIMQFHIFAYSIQMLRIFQFLQPILVGTLRCKVIAFGLAYHRPQRGLCNMELTVQGSQANTIRLANRNCPWGWHITVLKGASAIWN